MRHIRVRARSPIPIHVSLSYLASKLFMKIARLFKENINGKSFKANFYVELSIFLHVHNLHIINIFFLFSRFFPFFLSHFFFVLCSTVNVLFASCQFTATFFLSYFWIVFFPFKLKRLLFLVFFLTFFPLFSSCLSYFLRLTL